MSEVNELRVEIDPRIKQDDKLGPAVEAASDYFCKQVKAKPGIVLSTGRLSWGLLADRPGVVGVERAYSEPNEDGVTKRVTRTAFPASALLDPVEREVSMLQLLQDILRWRLDAVNESILHRLNQLDTEEENGLAHDR